jgi:diadenosine tetraphosphate (Ap4A) HIT family hydrolase
VPGSPETDCYICRQLRGDAPTPGGVVYEDELVVGVHAYEPELNPTPYLGHLLVEPKRHAYGVADLDDAEAAAIGVAVTRVARALKQAEGAEHVYLAVIGHHVPHLHVHLVPRYPRTPREFWSPLTLDESPEARRGGPDQVGAVVARVRAAL